MEKKLNLDIQNFLESADIFSPLSVAEAFSILIKDAVILCNEYKDENRAVDKWYRANCVACGSFVTGFRESERLNYEYFSCECGHEFDNKIENLSYYYVNVKKKVLITRKLNAT